MYEKEGEANGSEGTRRKRLRKRQHKQEYLKVFNIMMAEWDEVSDLKRIW